VVEGHADERGTNEYTLALGERRATAVRDYLVAAGIAADRIRTISYGEERPFVLGHDESAWRWNRRGHFVPKGSSCIQGVAPISPRAADPAGVGDCVGRRDRTTAQVVRYALGNGIVG